ncbi:hypothetical protein NC653_041579 [Populus alba x Populus x berolinensis]|uniref:Uncharacterized protein n=1 Tax=Populus alba x Populus x berolinensis TaxID=444605 RepID=A0AAD6L8V9_9ROSI|nr:hypothetical protein NC653_041579 [Populus alba x Populus x berolinensis]
MHKPWINMVAFPESALASQQKTLEDAGREYSAGMVICGDPLTNASAIKKSLILDWWKTVPKCRVLLFCVVIAIGTRFFFKII